MQQDAVPHLDGDQLAGVDGGQGAGQRHGLAFGQLGWGLALPGRAQCNLKTDR
jgi:hypothetical protein